MRAAVAFIRRCLAAGMDIETALLAAEQFDDQPQAPVLTKRQARNHRYYENKKGSKASENASEIVLTKTTKTVSDVSDAPKTVSDAEPASHTCAQVVTLSSSLRSEDNPPQTPSVSSPRKAKSTSKPSRRCPEGWEPSQRCRQVLSGEGFEPGDLERALTRMRDHEFKTARTDWDATFRNWVREDRDRKPRLIHDRPHDDRLSRKQANLARAFAGSERAAGFRGEP